jgi:hypothetical protein
MSNTKSPEKSDETKCSDAMPSAKLWCMEDDDEDETVQFTCPTCGQDLALLISVAKVD